MGVDKQMFKFRKTKAVQFGPLIYFSTLKFERKHLQFKNYSEISMNRINMTKSFAKHHQFRAAFLFSQQKFSSIDFFPSNLATLNTFINFQNENYQKVPANSTDIPRRCSNDILINVLFRGHPSKYWITPKAWFYLENSVAASGPIYLEVVLKRSSTTLPSTVKQLRKVYSYGHKLIQAENLHHQLSFLHVVNNTDVKSFYLLTGMI
ncbi:hypothetical protein TYRP_016422 [Tyrophagus putrescentiae]|nr:hypothetical protein TYRP_016422 [Tyrophagus putrescentiae]